MQWMRVFALVLWLGLAGHAAPSSRAGSPKPEMDRGKAQVHSSPRRPVLPDDADTDPTPPFTHMTAAIDAECGATSASAAQACIQAPRIWFQHGLAAVVTGIDPRGRRVGRKIWIAVRGPHPYLGKASDGRPVVAEVYAKQAAVLRDIVTGDLVRMIDQEVPRPDDLVGDELAKKGATLKSAANEVGARVTEQMNTVFAAAEYRFHAHLDPTLRKYGLDPSNFDLAFIDLHCEEGPDCQFAGDNKGVQDPAFHRYSKFKEWSRAKGSAAFRTPYRIRPSSPIAVERDSTLLPAAHSWPNDPAPGTAAAMFERLVENRRKKEGGFISYAAAATINLNARATLAVADVMDAPGLAGAMISPAGAQLKAVSDEFARTRLLECQRLRGSVTPKEIQDCSGYKVDMPTIALCANRGLCAPEPVAGAGNMVADLLFIAKPDKLKVLAGENLLPRVNLGTEKQAFETMSQCHEQHGTDYVAWAKCSTENTASADTKRVLDCLDDKNQGALGCARSFIGSEQDRKRLDCFSDAGAKAPALMDCAATAGLPKETRAILQCASKLGRNSATAYSGAVSKTTLSACLGPDVSLAKKCLEKWHGGAGWAAAAACGAKGQRLPKDAEALITCYQESPSDAAKAAACIAGKSLGGDGAKLIQCAVENNYDAGGTTLCMASDHLTADQRIFLQCAMQSGGEPATTATCTMGKLALKELGNCKGKTFGEEKCFDKNNEFRKFARTLGGDIGPRSVVADIVNVQLRLLEVTGADDAAESLSKQAGAVMADQMMVLDDVVKLRLDKAGRDWVKSQCRKMSFGVVKC